MQLTEKEKTILFYVLEAVQHTLREDDKGGYYANQSDYRLLTNELPKVTYKKLMIDIDRLLDKLC